MGKKIFLYLLILFILHLYPAYSKDKEYVFLSLDEVVHYAMEKDIELKALAFSFRTLVRSRKNLYRSLFPVISTSLGAANILSYGERDTSNYDFSVTLEQVLYNQLSSPVMLKNFGILLEEAKLKINERKKEIEKIAVRLYLDILLEEEKLKNKIEEYRLYQKFIELIREEYGIGMKTILDVIDTERKLLEVELELEQLLANKEILYKDLMNFIGFESNDSHIVMKNDLNYILFSQLNLKGKGNFTQIFEYILIMKEKIIDRDRLFITALNNDLEIKKMKLTLKQNSLKKKLLSIQFLENISLSYEVLFSGERIFPQNTTHTLAINVLLNFGILSSDISLSETSQEGLRSGTWSSESELLESLDPVSAGNNLRIEAYTTGKKIEEAKKALLKEIDVWIIKMNSLIKMYGIKMKQKEIFSKNEEIFLVKLEIGEVKQIDYLYFLIERNEFLVELEEVKYEFITLIWELEDILNVKVTEIAE